MAKGFLGIDIGTSGISAALIETGISGIRIEGARFVSFPQLFPDDDEITAALKATLEGWNLSSVECAASIPAREVHFRNLRLPSFDSKKIRSILLYELEPLLPFSVEEAITDFSVYLDARNPDQTDVVAATVKNSVVTRYTDILKSVCVEPEILTFQGYALALCFSQLTDKPTNWALVNLDGDSATCFLFESGQLAFIRCTPISTGKPSFEETLLGVIHPTIGAVESKLSFAYRPEIIWINPGLENNPPVQYQELEKRLGIPIQPADPIQELVSTQKLGDRLFEVPSRASGGFSLALFKSEHLGGIHFFIRPLSFRVFPPEWKFAFFKTGLLLCATVVFAMVYLLADLRITEAKVARLHAHLSQTYRNLFPEEKTIVDPTLQLKAKVESLKKQSPLHAGKRARIKRVDLLKEISTRIPKDVNVEIQKLTAGEQDVVVSGTADTFNAVNTMKGRLEGSPLFKEVVITSTNLSRAGNRVDFVLTLRF